jgi:hypothetical protein
VVGSRGVQRHIPGEGAGAGAGEGQTRPGDEKDEATTWGTSENPIDA